MNTDHLRMGFDHFKTCETGSVKSRKPGRFMKFIELLYLKKQPGLTLRL